MGWKTGISKEEMKEPITAEEIAETRRKCQIEDKVKVFNAWRAKRDSESYGKWEESRIKKKFPFVVLLENGRTVDYAEVALQRRECKK